MLSCCCLQPPERPPVTYTFATAAGTGTLSGSSFSNANVTFTATADAANVQEQFEVPFTGPHGVIYYGSFATVPLTSLTVAVSGLPAAELPLPVTLRFVYGSRDLEFSIANGGGYFGYATLTLPTDPDLLTGFTSVPVNISNLPFLGSTATAQGTFAVHYLQSLATVFTATPGAAGIPGPVPEPGSAALLGAGVLALAARRRWRDRRDA